MIGLLFGAVIGFLAGLYFGIKIGATKMVEDVLHRIAADPAFEKEVTDAIHRTLKEVVDERTG